MADIPEDQDLARCKVIIVGNSGVGKTSIISRYTGKFNPYEKMTIGASFVNKIEELNEKKVLFEIWDTAGQEKYRSINSIFYQDAYICLLVYDITKKQSFEDLKEYWYNSVLEHSIEDIIFHIVGNKIDLIEEEEVDRNEVKEYCDKIGANASFISAKEDNSNYVDILFNKLGEIFLQSKIYIENEKTKKIKNEKIKFDKVTEEKKVKKCC